MSTYLQILNRDELSDGTQILHVNEVPPPYSIFQPQQQSIDSDWKDEFIEIKPSPDNANKYGFVISGGIDMEHSLPIVITHIDYCLKGSFDNGRTKLRLFDRILSVDDIDLTNVTHDKVVEIFSSIQGHPILLHILRLNPINIEHIDLIMPSDKSNQQLGINIKGGLDIDNKDPGLFITRIDPNGLLASSIKNNQVHIGDRFLEIKTNYTSANLQWVTHSRAIQLIQRICQDSIRVTLVIAHRPSCFLK